MEDSHDEYINISYLHDWVKVIIILLNNAVTYNKL